MASSSSVANGPNSNVNANVNGNGNSNGNGNGGKRKGGMYAGPDGSSGSINSLAEGSDDLGLLRYWTPEMCTKSPHLFDFVVTVRPFPV